MDIITQKLLAIESDAQEAMNALAKEEAQLHQKIEADLARRVAEIENKGSQAIALLKQDSEAEKEARIARIKEEYKEKSREYTEIFNANRHEWREKILYDVLYGERQD